MPFKINVLNAAILSCIFATPISIYAQQPNSAKSDNQAEDIEVVKVLGILPQRTEALAGSFSIIDEEDLRQRRPISNLERMRLIPGINVVADGSMGFDTNIGFRGQNPRRSAKAMIMEDGVPLQLAPYTDPVVHYTTPSAVVNMIEVVKGAGQILYGPQTLGGAINFVTRPVPRSTPIAGEITSVFGNQNHRMLHASLGGGNDNGGIMVDISNNKGDGIFDGSDFDVKDYRIKAEFDLSEQQTIGLKIVHTNDRRNQTENYLSIDEYARDPFKHPTVELDEWEQDRDFVQLSHNYRANDNFTLRTTAYYTESFRNGLRGSNSAREVDGSFEARLRNCDVVGDTNGDGRVTVSDIGNIDIDVCGGRHAPRQYYTSGIESRADFNHTLFGYDNTAIVGIRYHDESAHRQQVFATNKAERLDYELALENDSANTREGTFLEAEAISYFAQNTIYIGDWSISPGLRIEDVTSSDQDEFTLNIEELSYTEFLPSLGVSWAGIQGTTIFAGVHSGISPARADREFTEEGGRAEPEESTLFEIGFRSDYFTGVSASATLFHNDISNTIVDLGETFENSGESEQQGLELAGRVDFKDIYSLDNNIYVSGAYTNVWSAKYVKAREPEDNGNRMQYSPKHMLNLDLGYEHSNGLHARIGVQHVGEQFVDDSNTVIENGRGTEGLIPSHTVWNATVNFDVQNTGITLFASVENLFDKQYLASRNEGKLPGRERLISAGVTFVF